MFGWGSTSARTSTSARSLTRGDRLFSRPVSNDQAAIERLLDQAAGHGTAGLAIDQPGSIGQLALRWPPSGARRPKAT